MWLARELSVKWAGSGSAGWRKLWLSDRGENAAHTLLVNAEVQLKSPKSKKKVEDDDVEIVDVDVDVDVVTI